MMYALREASNIHSDSIRQQANVEGHLFFATVDVTTVEEGFVQSLPVLFLIFRRVFRFRRFSRTSHTAYAVAYVRMGYWKASGKHVIPL